MFDAHEYTNQINELVPSLVPVAFVGSQQVDQLLCRRSLHCSGNMRTTSLPKKSKRPSSTEPAFRTAVPGNVFLEMWLLVLVVEDVINTKLSFG